MTSPLSLTVVANEAEHSGRPPKDATTIKKITWSLDADGGLPYQHFTSLDGPEILCTFVLVYTGHSILVSYISSTRNKVHCTLQDTHVYCVHSFLHTYEDSSNGCRCSACPGPPRCAKGTKWDLKPCSVSYTHTQQWAHLGNVSWLCSRATEDEKSWGKCGAKCGPSCQCGALFRWMAPRGRCL